MERQIDKDYFIKFANNITGSGEDYYSNWPKNLLAESPLLPGPQELVSTTSTINVNSFFDCLDANLCPIPDRMAKIIGAMRNSVRNILEGIVTNGGKLVESEDLKFFVDLQERYVKKYQVDNGRLIEKTEMLGDDKWKILLSPGWLSYVCWTLIEFLCGNTVHRLKKCPYCGRFFIAKDSKRKICYDSKCFRESKREQKQHQRATDPKKYM